MSAKLFAFVPNIAVSYIISGLKRIKRLTRCSLNLARQQTRMEERLDDAIHVLRTHAEGSLPPGMAPVVAGNLLTATSTQGGGYPTTVGSSISSAVQPMDQMVWLCLVVC